MQKLYDRCMVSPGSGERGRGAENYVKLFVAQKMTRNDALNRVHVAATERPQLLSQNTNMFEKGNRTKSLSDFVQL